MKGCVNMTDLSVNAQVKAITDALKKENAEFKTLTDEQKKKKAHEGLVKIGIINEKGEFTEPYVALGAKNVQ